MNKTIKMRTLKVQESVYKSRFRHLKYDKIVPSLKLSGLWLQDCGILPGDSVYIFVTSEKIEIRKRLKP